MDSIPSFPRTESSHQLTRAPDADCNQTTSQARNNPSKQSDTTMGPESRRWIDGKLKPTISRVLVLCFSLLFWCVRPQVLIRPGNIKRLTGGGHNTSFGGDVSEFAAFRSSFGTDPDPLFVYTTKGRGFCTTQNFGTKFLRMNGALSGTLPCGAGTTASATVLKTDLTLAIFYQEALTGASASSFFYELAYNSGTYTVVSQKNIQPTVDLITSALGEDNTDYVYYFTDNRMAGRYNQVVGTDPSPDPIHTVTTLTCPSPNSLYFHPTQTSAIIYFGLCTPPQIAFVDKSTLTETKTLLSPGGTGEGAYTHTLNNLDATVMYMAGNYRAYAIDTASSATEWVQLGIMFNWGSGTNTLNSNFINFGTNQFVGFMISVGTWTFNIYNKGDYTIVPSTYYPAVATSGTYRKYTLLGPYQIPGSERFVVSFMSSLGFNIHTFYLEFDDCLTRVNQICSQCSSGYYINEPAVADNWCYKEGFGVDTTIVAPEVALGYSSCVDPLCANCASHSVCTKCKVSNPQPLLHESICKYPPPAKFGKGTTDAWQPCLDSSCSECIEDNTYCNSCDIASGKTARLGVCVLPPSVPPGMGANLATGYAVACNTTSCLDCFNDHRYCLKCDTAQQYYLESTWCKPWSDIATTKGANSVTGLVTECSDRGCVDCRKNYTLCTECKVLEEYYLEGSVCVQKADIPYGKGVDTATGSLKKCSVEFCLECVADYNVCTRCDDTSGHFRHNSTCIHYEKLERGYGANQARGIASLCEATGCTVCNRNYMECSECLSSEGFVYRNGHCVLNFEPTYISFGFWDYKENLLKVSFNMVPEYRPSFEAVLDHVSVVDLKTSTTFSSKELNATATQTKYGFLLKFSPNETIVSGVLRIQQSANLTIMDRESRQVYSGFPIEIPGVYIIPPSAVTETVDNTLETASESRSLITLAIFSFNPMVAVALDFMFSELFVLKLYEGPFMAYPELLLRSTTESTILPVKIPNLLESDIEEDECVPSKSFQMNDMGCVFLDNYGDDIQKLLLLFAGTALISLIGRGILCCVSKQSQVTKGKFVTAVEFISVNYGLQMFHAKMEGEKMEVMVHLLLGMSHRRQSVFYTRNLVVMAVLQAYYWAVGVLGVTFTAEVGRFMSRSPLILALLRKHRLEIEKQTSMSVPNKPEDAADRLILIPEEDEVPKQPVKPAIAHKFHLEIPEENFERSPFQIQEPIFDPNEDLEICSEHVQGYPVINKTSARLPGKSEVGVVKQSEHSGKQESRKAIQSTVLRPSGQSATFVRIASASTGHQQALGIGPANIAFPIHIPEIACEGPQQEQQSSKKQAVTKRILLGKTAEGENTFPMYQEQTQTVTNRERTSFRLTQTPKHHSSQAKSSSKHPAPRRQKPAHFTQYIVNQSSSTYFSQMLKAKMERKIPEDFRPEAKEYFEFDKHTFSQISFFAAENTVTNNTWYRFAPLASFARASLLGIIVTRVVGHPQTQIICGMVIELIYLWYIVKAKYKSSLLEHRIDVTLQFLQILYLAQKLLTVFSILSDELKQDYLGLPMAVTLGLIAGVNIVFVLFNMGMLVFEVGVLIVTKIKDKFRQRRSTRR